MFARPSKERCPTTSGLGAATAGGFYASVAAFGLAAIADLLVGTRRPLGVEGGCSLVALAIPSLLSRPQAATDRRRGGFCVPRPDRPKGLGRPAAGSSLLIGLLGFVSVGASLAG